jgi:hypothetical protein
LRNTLLDKKRRPGPSEYVLLSGDLWTNANCCRVFRIEYPLLLWMPTKAQISVKVILPDESWASASRIRDACSTAGTSEE